MARSGSEPVVLPAFAAPAPESGEGEPSEDELLKLRELELRRRAEIYAIARQEGRSEAEREGEERLARELERARAALAEAVADFERRYRDWTESAKESWIELALETGKTLLRKELDRDKALVRRVLDQALAQLPDGLDLVLLLHPDDVEPVRESLEGESPPRVFELRGDPKVERGGCIVESPVGRLDATREVAEQQVASALRDGEEP